MCKKSLDPFCECALYKKGLYKTCSSFSWHLNKRTHTKLCIWRMELAKCFVAQMHALVWCQHGLVFCQCIPHSALSNPSSRVLRSRNSNQFSVAYTNYAKVRTNATSIWLQEQILIAKSTILWPHISLRVQQLQMRAVKPAVWSCDKKWVLRSTKLSFWMRATRRQLTEFCEARNKMWYTPRIKKKSTSYILKVPASTKQQTHF